MPAAKTYNKSFQITGQSRCQVESDDAKVRVTGTDDAQVEVSVEYDGYDLGKTFRIEARQEGSKVHVSVKTIGRIGISLNFKLAPGRGGAHAARRRSERCYG